jgi:bifunctional DNA-binding transcriptional regulator/antitoxin component of YhaV-PrlF toxin-antitoxin module
MVNMTKAIIQIKDDKQRRVVIPKEVWDIEGLQKDDYIEIDIKKIEKPKAAD